MYEKLNESPETEEEKIRHVDKRKLKNKKEPTERYLKARRMDCNKCGAPNSSIQQHECPAREKKCIECGKLGHYAKCCRSARKINHIADKEACSADEDDWVPERIHSIQQKIHSMEQKGVGTNGTERTTVLH